MKCLLRIGVVIAALASVPVDAQIEGRVVKVTKTAVVYAKPSVRSKALADVDPGALLVVRKVSPKGVWLRVEDEGGNQGWIDRRKTDLKIELDKLEAEPPKSVAKSAPADDSLDESQNRIVRNQDSPEAENTIGHRRVWMLNLRVRKAFADPNGDWALGLMGGGLFALEEGWLGFETGAMTYFGGYRGGHLIPLRLLYALPDGGARLLGVDLSAQMLRYPANSAEAGRWEFDAGAGLFLKRAFAFGGLWGLRLGIDFVRKTRFGVELEAGWHF